MARHAAKKKRKTWRQYMPLILAAALLLTAIFAVARLAGEQSGGEGSDGNDGTTVTSVTTTGETTTTMAEITTTTTTDRAIGVVTTMAPITTTTTTTTTTTNTTTTTTARPVTGHYVQKSVPSWELRLVNPWNPLPEDFNYTANLADYTTGKQFDSRAMTQLRQMIAAGSDYGLSAASLFRSKELQITLYNRQVSQWLNRGYSQAEAEAKAATVVARPGTSEHHVGLAADVLGSGYASLEESFENTPAFAWLKAHCAEYGFILRYPKEKEDITGVIYEPWHYRYVGVEAATEIMRRGITLEEYLEEKYA